MSTTNPSPTNPAPPTAGPLPAAPVEPTVNSILADALQNRATDIHLEPRAGRIQVRQRIDGVLKETSTLSLDQWPTLVGQIKTLVNLKLSESDIPQDGRSVLTSGDKTLALRVSTIPIMDGEKVMIRLSDQTTRAQTLAELGFEEGGLTVVTSSLLRPHGLMLITGPTGSGKSSTVFSLLTLLNTPGVDISTVEDPVEYRLEGVNQTQINPKTGMTLAGGLRTLLRQDANIIMVSEIREHQTAELAVQAALSGRVVLSTLPTTSAAAALTRLGRMGIPPHLLAAAVNLIINQRLVRRLCPHCRQPYKPTREEWAELQSDGGTEPGMSPGAISTAVAKGTRKVIAPSPELRQSILDRIATDPSIINRGPDQAGMAAPSPTPALATPAGAASPTPADEPTLFGPGPGCAECGGSGYRGRIGIYEVLEMSPAITKLLQSGGTTAAIDQAATAAGRPNLRQDGYNKVRGGLTSFAEVRRVAMEPAL